MDLFDKVSMTVYALLLPLGAILCFGGAILQNGIVAATGGAMMATGIMAFVLTMIKMLWED